MLLVRGSLIEQSFPTLSLKVLNIWSKISINGRQFISILSYARYEAVTRQWDSQERCFSLIQIRTKYQIKTKADLYRIVQIPPHHLFTIRNNGVDKRNAFKVL